jgi:hypothetical protein
MGEAARTVAVDRYAWPAIAKRLEEIYTSLVEPGVRAAA